MPGQIYADPNISLGEANTGQEAYGENGSVAVLQESPHTEEGSSDTFNQGVAVSTDTAEGLRDAIVDPEINRPNVEDFQFTSQPDEDVISLFKEGSPDVVTRVESLASEPYELCGKDMEERRWAIRILEGKHGSISGWKETISEQSEDSDILRSFIEMRDIGVMCCRNAYDRYSRNVDAVKKAGQYDVDASVALTDQYGWEVKEALKVALPYDDDPTSPDFPKHKMVSAFFNGDYSSYRFDVDLRSGKRTITDRGRFAVDSYLSNIAKITPETALLLNKGLGIVKFDRYSERQLRFAANVVRKDPETLDIINNSGGVSLLISGRNGDYKGAFNHAFKLDSSENAILLPVEVETGKGLDKIVSFLEERGIKHLRHLTVAGHGDKAGLHVSKRLTLEDGDRPGIHPPETASTVTHKHTAFRRLYSMLLPVRPGDKPGEITLLSCSQARKFIGRRALTDAIAIASGAQVNGADSITTDTGPKLVTSALEAAPATIETEMIGPHGISRAIYRLHKKTHTKERIRLHDWIDERGLFRRLKTVPVTVNTVARPDGKGGYTIIRTPSPGGKVRLA